MATKSKQVLKAYVRIDGSGRDVNSSLVLRQSKPKNGKWRQIQGYQCCDDFLYTTSTTSTTSTTTTLPSDMRLKKSITLTGRKIGGFDEYSWEWNESALSLGYGEFRKSGVLAQEVLLSAPEAVIFNKSTGYFMVDYSKL